MSTIDTNRPYIAYTLITACSCQKTNLYQRTGGKLVEQKGKWAPEEPHLETDVVSIEKRSPLSATGEITGVAHRELEMDGNLKRFIGALLDGETIASAAERFIGEDALA
jgi:hypothetical protein